MGRTDTIQSHMTWPVHATGVGVAMQRAHISHVHGRTISLDGATAVMCTDCNVRALELKHQH
jgi:hypothetical protein